MTPSRRSPLDNRRFRGALLFLASAILAWRRPPAEDPDALAGGIISASLGLLLKGSEPLPDSGKGEKWMLDVAANKLDRATTTQRLRKLLKRQRKPRHG